MRGAPPPVPAGEAAYDAERLRKLLTEFGRAEQRYVDGKKTK